MPFCPNCGHKIDIKVNYCPNCGHKNVSSREKTANDIIEMLSHKQSVVANMFIKQTTKEAKNEQISDNMQLKCQSCNGVMDIDKNREILFCPYCGSKELLKISDAVKIEKIRNETKRDVEFGKQKVFKDIKMAEYNLKMQEKKHDTIFVVGIMLLVVFMMLILLSLC